MGNCHIESIVTCFVRALDKGLLEIGNDDKKYQKNREEFLEMLLGKKEDFKQYKQNVMKRSKSEVFNPN